MIRTLLIANRGEIACRIIRTCREMGVRAVAVYSEADARARHVKLADTAIALGPAPSTASYLNQQAILDAARRTGADAIHPGYGFLAENADFARACADAGLIFVGPDPDAIALMGNKRAAKAHVAAAEVPVLPGTDSAGLDDAALHAAAERLGYPLLVKAAAGGGGKGMRIVGQADELSDALAAARREAQQAFGNDELLLEKLLVRPRHVEVQLLGDRHGNLLYLGERDCSLQRRHQKVIEETPAPDLPPDLRRRLGETAVTAARTVGYYSAGTVEFLLDDDGRFYFLEMNTRLQVEHPVTELVTGLDLVAWQMRVAEGVPLPFSQTDIAPQGHAVEARLYAENPANDFLPVTGVIHLWQSPTGPGLRVDDGVRSGDEVTIHYDPLLAKICAHGPDRATAVRRLRQALATAVLLGPVTNLPFLRDVVAHDAFAAGEVHTGFLAQHFTGWQPPRGDVDLALKAAALIRYGRLPRQNHWRNNPTAPLWFPFALDDNEVQKVWLWPEGGGRFRVGLAAEAVDETAEVHGLSETAVDLTLAGVGQKLTYIWQAGTCAVQTSRGVVVLAIRSRLPAPAVAAGAGGSLRAPMPGVVLAVLVAEGEEVAANQPLLKMEAMKMEHTIRTAAAGVVEAVYYQPGDTVEAEAALLAIRPL